MSEEDDLPERRHRGWVGRPIAGASTVVTLVTVAVLRADLGFEAMESEVVAGIAAVERRLQTEPRPVFGVPLAEDAWPRFEHALAVAEAGSLDGFADAEPEDRARIVAELADRVQSVVDGGRGSLDDDGAASPDLALAIRR